MGGVSASEDVNQTINDDASDFVSVSQNDTGFVESSDVGTFTELEKEIDDAEDGSTIVLKKNYAYNSRSDRDTGSIHIFKNLTINGNGYAIDAKNMSRIFVIDAFNVTLNNMYLKNANHWGGAIYLQGSNENIINIVGCKIVNCSADYGAVYSSSNVNVFDCCFINCSGGAINHWGINVDFFNIVGCSFINCSSYLGGAIYCPYTNGIIANSTFANNSAGDSGGVVYSSSHVDFKDCTFINNSPNDIYVYTSLQVIKNVFLVNESVCVSINDWVGLIENITGNITLCFDGHEETVKVNGGLVTLPLNNLDVGEYEFYVKYNGNRKFAPTSNTTMNIQIVERSYASYSDLQYLIDTMEGDTLYLTKNYIYGLSEKDDTINVDKRIIINGNGHIIHGDDDLYYNFITNSTIIFENVTFENSESYAIYSQDITCVDCSFINGGGAIYSEGDVNVSDCIFLNNFYWSNFNGGAIYSKGSVSVSDCSFIGNSHGGAVDNGGAVYCLGDLTVFSSNFTQNSAEDFGGAIYSCGSVSVSDCNFLDNNVYDSASHAYGGAVYCLGDLTVFSSNFTQNSAEDSGGAIYSGGSVSVRDCNFLENNAKYVFGNANGGGAIYCMGDLNVSSSDFINNFADLNGGAIYSKGNLTISVSNFINNSGGNGGAINIASTSKGTVISECNFVNNIARGSPYDQGYGGAINIESGDIVISDCNFLGNSLKYGCSISCGGAICSRSNLTVSRSNFTNNSIDIWNDWGGAIYSSGILTIHDSLFINNFLSGGCGGAIYSSGILAVHNSDFINSQVIEFNSYGGAIYSVGDSTICASRFINNSADGYNDCGGAIYSGGNLNISCSDFINNYAKESGGAIYSKYTFTVCDSNFINNSVDRGTSGSINANGMHIFSNNNVFDNNTPSYYRDPLTTYIKINDVEDNEVLINKKDIVLNIFDNVGLVNEINKNVTCIYDYDTVSTLNIINGTFKLSNLKNGKYTIVMEGDIAYASCNRSFFIIDSTYHSFTELQGLIDNTPEFGILNLNYNYIYGLDEKDTQLLINKSITINGNGHIIRGTDIINILKIDALNSTDQIYLNDLVFSNGNNMLSQDGKAIYINVGNTTIKDCIFINNRLSDYAAIYSDCEFDIINSTFLKNAMAIHSTNNLRIVNSSFIDNNRFADASYIYFNAHEPKILILASGNLSIYNSNFENNLQVLRLTDGNLTISNCTFVNNTAEGGGGVIFSDANTKIFDCNFINNKAADFIYFVGLGYGRYLSDGGAIISWGNLSIFNSNFVGNSALKNGGAIFSWGNLSVFNSNFVDNVASRKGGAIYNFGNCTVASSSFLNNGDSGEASDIYILTPVYGENYNVVYPEQSYYPVEWIGTINNDWLINLHNSIVNVTNITIANSIFLNNNSYNHIFSRKDSYDVDLYNIWFGNTVGNYKIKPNGNAFDIDSWLFLNITTNPLNIKKGESSVISFNLNNLYNSESKTISHPDISQLPDIYLNLSCTGGYINNASILPNENVKFTLTEDNGAINVSYNKFLYSIYFGTYALSAKDVTKNYGGSECLEITLTKSGEPIANANVNIDINDVHYTRTTNSDGKALMDLNFNVGEYYARITYQDVFTTATIFINQINTETTLSSTENGPNSVTLAAVVSPTSATGVIIFKVNDKYYSAEISDSVATYTLKDLDVGNYTVQAFYKGDINHKSSTSNSISFEIGKALTVLNADDVSMNYGDNDCLTVTLTEDGCPIAFADVNVDVGGSTYTITTGENGEASMPINLNSGVYGAVISYNGVSTTATITVNQLDTETALSFTKNRPNSVTLTADVGPATLTGEITFKVNDKDYTAKISDSVASYTLKDLDAGNYAVQAFYKGDINHKSSTSNSISFEVGEASYVLTAPEVSEFYGAFKDFVVTLKDGEGNPISDAQVKIKINDKTSTITTDNGKASFSIDLPVGSYDVVCEYANARATSKITVESTISADDVSGIYGNAAFKARFLDTSGKPLANSKVQFTIDSKTYDATTDSNGIAGINIGLDAGEYKITSINPVNDEKTTNNLVISKLDTNVSISQSMAADGVVLSSSIDPKTAGGKVTFIVNDTEYPADIKNGIATVTVTGLTAGNYNAVAKYGGDSNYNPSESNEITVTINDYYVIVTAPDVDKYYHGPERFTVNLADNKGNPVTNASVSININGNTYTRVTDSNGVASMAVNLNSGVYTVTTRYNSSEVLSTVTIKSTVSGENVTKIFRNGTQYYATFVDTSGKTLAENTAVEFNINGVFYTRYTNDKGVARMNINLNPGEYVITAKNPNSGEMYTNVITVLPSIVENYDLTKYYRNASQYLLRLLDDKGNPVGAGVDIRLNINGVFYTRTSNATGHVRMNINLEPGEYIITAEYNGLMASNKIRVLSVIETHDLTMKYKDGSKFEAKILDGQGKAYAGQKVTFNINGVFYEKLTDENGIARLSINLMAGEYIITTSYNGMNAANKVTISS